jgi:hypothetical protein
MEIILNASIFHNKEIIGLLEEEFGGLTQDTCDFLLADRDDEEDLLITCDDSSYEAISLCHTISDFLQERGF